VSQTCANFEDVKKYVDANIAELKDFVGEIVKKLPQPARLQVEGKLRKTLTLWFRCCKTGREVGIISHDWNKWLKIGFSLVKLGVAVVQTGVGDPLALVSTGVDTVKEVYNAYKTTDDQDFNTYITQPFLTSAESDDLINKLRDQQFFDKFAYDKQAGAWYLMHPEKDGTLPPAGVGAVQQTGSVAPQFMAKKEDKPTMTAEEAARAAQAATPAAKAAVSAQQREAGAGVGAVSPTQYAASPAALSSPAPSSVSSPDVQAFAARMEKAEKTIESLEKRLAAVEARPSGGGCLIL